MLAGYPEVTIVNTKELFLPERDENGYIKGQAPADNEEPDEEAVPSPIPQASPQPKPQPQYYLPDPKSFATN
ncbi:MAG: hypothetical protein RJB39_664 [Candidatus Parcubacteria bacterium]